MKILSIVTRVEQELACWTRISKLARELERGGHQVVFGVYSQSSVFTNGTIPHFRAAHIRVSAPRPFIPFIHVANLLRGDFDLVFANMQFACMYGLLGRTTRIPLVFDRHGDIGAEMDYQNEGQPCSLKRAFLAGLDRLIDDFDVGCSSAVICVSRSMMDTLIARGVGCEKLIYVTNGADLDFFKPQAATVRDVVRRRHGVEGDFVVGYLGGGARWQGIDELVQATDYLADSEITVLIVGGPKKRIVARRVIHIPRVSSSQMPSYYSACDALVLPRPHNPATVCAAPTKFAEYSAMGKPILTTPVGDPARFVKQSECGIVTSDCSPTSIARGMVQLESAGYSALNKMGANARRLAEQEYDWERIGDKLLNDLERFA